MIIKLKWFAGEEYEVKMSATWHTAGTIADALVDSYIERVHANYLVDRYNRRCGWERVYKHIPPGVAFA